MSATSTILLNNLIACKANLRDAARFLMSGQARDNCTCRPGHMCVWHGELYKQVIATERTLAVALDNLRTGARGVPGA